MVSRDTTVHISAVLVGVATLLLLSLFFDIGNSPRLSVAVALLWNGLVLAGAHLYLAIRGEDGLVSVQARWRYVALIAVVLGAGAIAAYGGNTGVGPLSLSTIGVTVVVVAITAYLVTETVSGYRSSRPE